MLNSNIRRLVSIVAALAVAGASGCGGGGSASGNGSVSIGLTDSPVDMADQVVVQVSGVAFKREDSAPETVQNLSPSLRQINLLQYQQGNVALLLDKVMLPAGRYQWLRLIIDAQPNVRDSFVVVNGRECELSVPSGAETGLKLNRGFTLPADGSVALTIEFDLRQSLRAPPGQKGSAAECTQGYLLRPTLRVVDNANVGAIAGTVAFAAGTVSLNCMPKVYLFAGAVTPDDMEDTTTAMPDVDPLAIFPVDIPAGMTFGTYKAAFIPAGSYTAAFTCDDDTTADEVLDFVPAAGTPVTVQNNLISTVDFTVPAGP
jgi:hypothetical protein